MKQPVSTRPENDNGRFVVFEPGDRVVLTAAALLTMGVRAASSITKVWTVRECFCAACQRGRLVCTDQAAEGGGWRHIARSSLRHAGQPTVDELPLKSTVVAGRWAH